jgi:flagellar hook protein FlgE
MSITGALSTAVSGLQASAVQFGVAAHNVANLNSDGYKALEVQVTSSVPGGTNNGRTFSSGVVETKILESNHGVDLAQEYVNMTIAKISYTANAEVIRTLEDMTAIFLDIEV